VDRRRMESQARLTIHDVPELGVGARSYALTCPHGTTHTMVIPGPSGSAEPRDDGLTRMLLVGHDQMESCECTRELWCRYGA
jgi:hypothetical protein